jgi:multimeric flavodoxin WrbA
MTNELFPKWQAADLVVYATPLYYHTINAAMSRFWERTLPMLLPFFEQDEKGNTYHPMRGKVPATVLLSVCGFPEASEFNALTEFLKSTRHKDSQALATIFRAGASLLTSPVLRDKANDVLAATRQAGRELIKTKQIDPATMARITQPLGNLQSFAKMGNIYWKTCIAEGVTPKEFDDKKMVPRPGSLEDFMFIFPFGLNAGTAGDRKVVLQFNFSGEVDDSCHFTIEKGKVNPNPGAADKPDLTIETPFHVWMDIMTRKADGGQMLMEQKYKVHGDLALMMKLFQKGNSPG